MSEYIEDHLAGLSDSELIAAFREAESDLAEAAAQQPNSDWHQSCFAGLYIYGTELTRRGISLATKH